MFAVTLEVDPGSDQSGAKPRNAQLLKSELAQTDGSRMTPEQPQCLVSPIRRYCCYGVAVVSAEALRTPGWDEKR